METADILKRVQSEAFPLQMQEYLRPIINMRRVVDRPTICNALTTKAAVEELKQDAELGKDTALVVWAESRDDGAEDNRLNPWRVNVHTQTLTVAGDIFWPSIDSQKRDSQFYGYVREWCHVNFGDAMEYVKFVQAITNYRNSLVEKKVSKGKKLLTRGEVVGCISLAEMAMMVMDGYRKHDLTYGEVDKDRFGKLWTEFGFGTPKDSKANERGKVNPIWFWENVYPKDGVSQ